MNKEKIVDTIVSSPYWTGQKTRQFLLSCTKTELEEIYNSLENLTEEKIDKWNESLYKNRQSKRAVTKSTLKPTGKSIKCKQKTARKLKAAYHSVFTNDMSTCLITGSTENVHPHHIFSGGRKTFSEKYGFMLPIVNYLHEGNKNAIHENKEMDLYWKRQCETYWINTMKRTKEEWVRECGKWW